MNNDQVALSWLDSNLYRECRSAAHSKNKNFWFDGPSLYSDRTEIARVMVSPYGHQWVLSNYHNYSKTTVKHYSQRFKVIHKFNVREIGVRWTGIEGLSSFLPNGFDAWRVIEHKIEAWDERITKLNRSRTYKRMWAGIAESTLDEAVWLAKEYNVGEGQ
jgi:hypothetical protein